LLLLLLLLFLLFREEFLHPVMGQALDPGFPVNFLGNQLVALFLGHPEEFV
jgi:hypothetical protein